MGFQNSNLIGTTETGVQVPLAVDSDGKLLLSNTAGWSGSVSTYADLPSATGSGLVYLVENSTGLFWNKRAGLYQDTGVGTWDRLSNANLTPLDSETTFSDDGDNTKKMNFQLDGITTGTTRTMTIPDIDGTIVVTEGTQTINGTKTIENLTVSDDFIPPNKTTVERDAIASPTESQLIYNTDDNQYQYYDSASAWSALGGGSGSLDITQSTHGFSVQDVLYNNAGTWTKALADDAETLGIGIVTAVADTDNFTVTCTGVVTITGHALIVGDYYYLSEGTAGLLTSTAPSTQGNYSAPIVYVLDSDNVFIMPWRPIEALMRNTSVSIETFTSATVNCTEYDEMILADAVSNNITVNLLSPETKYTGFVFTVKKIDSSANTVTVKSASGNIDGVVGTTGKVISVQYNSLCLVCDGTNYWIR